MPDRNQTAARAIFVAWTRYMRRPDSMRPFYGYRLLFLPAASGGKLRLAWSYLSNAVRTVLALISYRPAVIWVQLAPVFPLYIASAYRFFRRRTLVVADCHNSMFGERWAWAPFGVTLLNRCTAVLVHNSAVRASALAVGVREEVLYLLETRPAQLAAVSGSAPMAEASFGEQWVLVPSSFSGDEPIAAILDAANLTPHVRFVVTGNLQRAKARHDLSRAPGNVTFTGFIERELLDRYLCVAPVVMGLTTRMDIQLSVANEAAGAARAMVISDTPLLRSLFPKGAIYVQPNAESIAQGLRAAFERREALQLESEELREWREARWLEQARGLAARLHGDPVSGDA